MMENTAKHANDRLVDLMSSEGEWFLDDMRLVSTLIIELIQLLPEDCISEPKLAGVIKCLKSANAVHKDLQELNYNFHTIILPEATKTVITEEPSVGKMISELDDIVQGNEMPVEDIIEQLEKHLK